MAVNQTPVVSIASPYTTNEDTSVTLTGETFTGSGIQKIGVADSDDAGQTYTAVITVTKGTVTADNNAAPSVGISGNNSAAVTLTGTLTAITALLKDAGPQGSTGAPGLVFTPAANANNNTAPSGAATILVTLNDGLLTGQDNSTITINPVNDAPTISVPPTVNLTESGSAQNVSLGSTVFSDDASETPGANVSVTMSVTQGMLTLRTDVVGGLVAGQITGNGTGSLTLSGTIAQIDTTLAQVDGLKYTSPAPISTVSCRWRSRLMTMALPARAARCRPIRR